MGMSQRLPRMPVLTAKHSYSVVGGSGFCTYVPESVLGPPPFGCSHSQEQKCEKERCAHTPLYSVDEGVLLRYRQCCQQRL